MNQPRQTFSATITAQYVNMPKPDKKMGNIKSSDGLLWFAYPSDLMRITQGDNITVEYTESTNDRGTSRFVTKLAAINGGEAPPPPSPTAQAPLPDGRPEPPPHTGQAPHAPATPSTPASGADSQAESIFITGVVGRTMQSGQFSITDIALLTKAAVQAWRDRHGDAPF